MVGSAGRRLWRWVPATLLIGAVTAMAGGPADTSTLHRIVVQDCGSCHGLRLTGGLGPPVTPTALADWEVEELVAVIERGREGTAMPPFGPLFTDEELRWIAEGLKNGRFLDKGD